MPDRRPKNSFEIRDLLLLFILLMGAALRFYGLDHQSFWVDELHTVNEADPSLPWSELFHYLKCCDPHPPLFFIAERLVFTAFGISEVTARIFSALCGVLAISVHYKLGKELAGKDLGLVAALITSVNFFNIDYSQEARGYALVMLLSALSFLYFIRLLKTQNNRNLMLYIFFCLLMLYTHYYGLFIVASQGLVALMFLMGIKEGRQQFFRTFAFAGAAIVLGYLPWTPFLRQVGQTESFWISPIPATFFISYFFDYFDNYPKLNPLLVLLILFFLWNVVRQKGWAFSQIRQNSIQLTFVVFFTAVITTYFVPYLRSLYAVPMLYNRYTIVVLPAFIIAIAVAFMAIPNAIARYAAIGIFVFLSLHDIINRRYYYSKDNHMKTQFREMTQFISADSTQRYPIVEARTGWHHRYYLRKFRYDVPVLSGNKEATIDSIILRKNAPYEVDGFWLVGAHGFEPHLLPNSQSKLDSAFIRVAEKEFFDTWAQLYIRKKEKETE